MVDEIYRILKYVRKNGECPFDQWFSELESNIQIIVNNRLVRLRLGLFGDTKNLGQKINEVKIDVGPGYRIYFYLMKNQILILNAGDKKTQNKDISNAKKYLVSYFNEGNYAS